MTCTISSVDGIARLRFRRVNEKVVALVVAIGSRHKVEAMVTVVRYLGRQHCCGARVGLALGLSTGER
jgi:ethanolamine transporter EutH